MQLGRKDLDKLRVQQQRPEDMGVLSDRVHTGHEQRRHELRGDRGQRSGDEAPLTAQQENEAEHDTERRLVDETAEGEAGTKWPIPTHRREADRPEEQRDGAQLAIENHREEERRTRGKHRHETAVIPQPFAMTPHQPDADSITQRHD